MQPKASRSGSRRLVQLKPPPRRFEKLDLPTVEVAVDSLFRVSRFNSGEPYFGRTAGNRFDDRARVKRRRFGTCYCGTDLEVAVAETILHDEMPKRGSFKIAWSEFANRYLVRFTGRKLILANLTGASLKMLAGDGSISTLIPYRLPQLWSMAIHTHPAKVDGILYMSRHVNDKQAAVIYDRARSELRLASYTPLLKARDIRRVIADLKISFEYRRGWRMRFHSVGQVCAFVVCLRMLPHCSRDKVKKGWPLCSVLGRMVD